MLPAIPQRGSAFCAADLLHIEAKAIELVPFIDDLPALEEWAAQARALETYLRDRELQGPMRGVARRCEARIGQLLGEPVNKGPATLRHDVRLTEHHDRHDFRLLARALNGEAQLTPEEWRSSRRALIALIRERLHDGSAPIFSPIIKSSDNWNFSPITYGRIDGENGHGYIPGEIYANCLWYWTKAHDIVAAPMAGSGQIMRVYEDRATWARPSPWELDVRMFDLNPRGPYANLITANDLIVNLPVKRANYIVLDVPYFGMAEGQYSAKSNDLSNMDDVAWTQAIEAIAGSCSRVQEIGDLCTVITPNYRDVPKRNIFLATAVVRERFVKLGYALHDLAYASRRIQQLQNPGMGKLNNAAKRERVMLTDIAEIITFRLLKEI